MECFYRVTFGNQVSIWRRGKSHHMDWIRSYDEQPLRGRENEVMVGRPGEGDRDALLPSFSAGYVNPP